MNKIYYYKLKEENRDSARDMERFTTIWGIITDIEHWIAKSAEIYPIEIYKLYNTTPIYTLHSPPSKVIMWMYDQ